jgi:hypothetical protein
MKSMTDDPTKLFTKTIPALIRPQAEKYGLVGTDFLVAYCPLTGRVVITFAVEPILPVKEAAE